MQTPNRSSYTAAELLDWLLSKSLILTPKFQRRGVWPPAARSFFVDTLLRGMPVPPVYVRLSQSPKKDRVVREVIDGQQRIAAVTAFMRDEYALSRSLVAPWKGKRFSQLNPVEQDTIRNYPFNAESFQGISDAEVLEIFSRLNTYSVPLNDQELRNGRFFGHFKQVVYTLAYDHLEFWRYNNIFSERSIAKMAEAELVSELLAACIAGQQNSKKTLDSFYMEYDEEFVDKEKFVKRFKSAMSDISDAFDDRLPETEFHRSPLFYTLFCVVYHRRFGLPNVDIERPKKGDAPLTRLEKMRLVESVVKLSDILINAKEKPPQRKRLIEFVSASRLHTDNLKPREIRFATLYEDAFL